LPRAFAGREATHVASTVEALARVSDIVAAQTRPEELLDRVLHFAAQVLDASGAAALLLDERGEQLVFTAALGTHAQALIGQKTRVGEGIAGHVVQSGEIAIVNDSRADSRFSGHIDSRIGFDTRSVLCVPLKVRERILGVLEVLNREGAPGTPADAEVLQAVANQAAIALDNAHLYQQLEQRVEESQGELALANRQLQADKTLLQPFCIR
jgi:GAF domain-containing protein